MPVPRAPKPKPLPTSAVTKKRAKVAPPPGPAWKRAQRAALAGARRPHPLDPPPPLLTREQGWAALLEAERAEDELCGPMAFENASARALYEPVGASYALSEPPTKLDAAVERLRAGLLHTHPPPTAAAPAWQALVAFWAGTAGLGFVFDVCGAPEPWSYLTSGLSRTLVGPPDAIPSRGRGWGRLGDTFLRELRRLLFALPEADFIKARDQALAWLEQRPKTDEQDYERESEKAAVAYALARDPTLAHELTRKTLAHHRGGSIDVAHLLTSITDLSLARRLVEHNTFMLPMALSPMALDVVEAFGRDAADMIQHLLDETAGQKAALRSFDKTRLEAARKLALTDPRPPTPRTTAAQ